MKRSISVGMALLTIFVMAFSAATPVAAQPNFDIQGEGEEPIIEESVNGIYIVQMLEEPVITYEGDVAGLDTTKPVEGEKVDPGDPDVTKYVSYLEETHDQVLNEAGGGEKVYDYTYSFNGFAAQLTLQQANKLATADGVLTVSPDTIQTVDTSSTPTFLGLDAKHGLWYDLGGPWEAGNGVVIGVIDSGVWPENLSFADNYNKRTQQWTFDTGRHIEPKYSTAKNWSAPCTFTDAVCNKKLIGAQYFNAAWGGDAGIAAQRPWEYLSPRDYNGHGTHTASTAGGNYRVTPTGPAEVFGPISGIAPHAYISVYKALWSTQDGSTASGATSDLVAAIDQAVADGVDVINYSVSGSQTNFLDPVEIAFLNAADAGVFVAASAGNSGPTASTVAHPSPWVTTVAAGTHNRGSAGSVTLGNGVTYTGASLAATTVTAPLIDATAAGAAGASATAVRLCYSTATNGGTPALDPALVAGKIVVCDRGTNARVDKSLAVQEAGGVGMILVNTSASSLNADLHYIPTVHLPDTDRTAIKDYAATSGATATINQAVLSYTDPAPYTASFSSRGPLQAGAGDLLKPDLIAPGQDILAAVSPAIAGRNYDLYSGTSMSAPHVAGLAALFKEYYPKWSPMMIKSALMTSAYDVLDGPNTSPSVIFSQGAGHVRPNSATDPGLVYDSSYNDWLAFLCGATSGVNPTFCSNLQSAGYSLDPSDMNVPSIAIGALPGAQTVSRTVTNVGPKEKYTFSYTGLEGITVTPNVNSFTVAKNKTFTYNVTFTTNGAPLGSYVGGYITWRGNKGHVVRIPVVVRPVALAAPAQVSGSYSVTFGYEGPFSATARGLVPATTFEGEVNTGEYQVYAFDVPDGTTLARFSLFDANVSPASDLDLYIFDSTFVQIAASAGGTSEEEVNLTNPVAGTYYILVDGYATGNPSTFTVFAWALGTADAGNMVVTAPTTATVGGVGTIDLSFNGLTPGVKYLGAVVYDGNPNLPGPTFVRVDP